MGVFLSLLIGLVPVALLAYLIFGWVQLGGILKRAASQAQVAPPSDAE